MSTHPTDPNASKPTAETAKKWEPSEEQLRIIMAIRAKITNTDTASFKQFDEAVADLQHMVNTSHNPGAIGKYLPTLLDGRQNLIRNALQSSISREDAEQDSRTIRNIYEGLVSAEIRRSTGGSSRNGSIRE